MPGVHRRASAVLGATGALIGAVATVATPFLSLRPNRIVEGVTLTATEAFGALGWLLVVVWIALGWASLKTGARSGFARGLLGASLVTIVLLTSGDVAAEFAASTGPHARTSFSWGFYLALLGLFLTSEAAFEDMRRPWQPVVVTMCFVLAFVIPVAAGAVSELAIAREFTLARDTFAQALSAHLFYALGATASAVAIGVPLGIWAARHKSIESAVMGTLNLGQVFPALAFIGLMMPVFGALGRNVKALDALGVAGIGWAPVFCVLLVYALFPVVRNTLAAIRSLDAEVLDAARGVGMGRLRTFAEVELPLASPIVLAGVRVALVQSTAGAVLAAFVGGGGLGTLVFFGLEQTSTDLVLVGVVPIIALALLFDAGLRGAERLVVRLGAQTP